MFEFFFSFSELYFLITKFLANGPLRETSEVSKLFPMVFGVDSNWLIRSNFPGAATRVGAIEGKCFQFFFIFVIFNVYKYSFSIPGAPNIYNIFSLNNFHMFCTCSPLCKCQRRFFYKQKFLDLSVKSIRGDRIKTPQNFFFGNLCIDQNFIPKFSMVFSLVLCFQVFPSRIDWTGQEHEQTFAELVSAFSNSKQNFCLRFDTIVCIWCVYVYIKMPIYLVILLKWVNKRRFRLYTLGENRRHVYRWWWKWIYELMTRE